MTFKQLESYLNNIKKVEKSKSIFIYGEWGIGKSYFVAKYLKDNNITNIYFNLFSIISLESIFNELTKIIDSKYLYYLNDSFVMNTNGEHKFNSVYIIFDEFDRKNESISDDNIYSLINSLRLLGFTVITISNNCNHNSLLEKTFDYRIPLNTSNREAVSNILEKNKIKDAEDIRDIKNLRIFERAIDLYLELESSIVQNGKTIYEYFDLPKSDLISICYKIIELDFENLKSPENDEDFATLKTKYGNNIALILSKIKWNFTDEQFNQIVKPFVLFYYIRDINEIFEKTNKSKRLLPDILYKPFFLLSSDDRDEYLTEVVKNIDLFDFTIMQHRNIFNIYLQKVKKPTRLFFAIVAKKFIDSYKDDLIDIFEYEEEAKIGGVCLNEQYLVLHEAILSKIQDFYRKKIEKAFESKQYREIIDLYYKNQGNKVFIKIIIELIKEKKYFDGLNLSGTLDYDEWKYCHFIFDILKGDELNAFKDFIKNLDKENDEVGKERIKSLLTNK